MDAASTMAVSVQQTLTAFTMQTQLSKNWCWAAVTSSVIGYYQALASQTPHPPPQCIIVSQHTGRDYCNFVFPDDGADLGELEFALQQAGHLNAGLPGFANFDTGVKFDINRRRPIGVGIRWGAANIGHFVCIVGYCQDANGEFVVVVDPQIPAPTVMTFETLMTNYRNANGKWVSTYFTIS